MKTYKGFDKDLKCRDFQYEIGKEYEMDGKIEACSRGFHACEMPLDVFDYYSPADGSRYCEVEQSGDIDKGNNDSKVASSKIKIGAEIGIAGLVKAHVEYVKEKTTIDPKSAQIGSSGDWAKIGSSGDWAKIGSSGYRAQIGSSGDWAQIGSSGDWAKIGSSGDMAKIGSSGDMAKIGSSGDGAQIGSSGDWAQIECSGQNAVAMCAGINSAIKGPVGTWITLAEYNNDGICVCCKSARIDGETLKADTWYILNGGEFVEAKE